MAKKTTDDTRCLVRSRPNASLIKASARSRSMHSSGDCVSTRRFEDAEGELHDPMPLMAWVRLTKVVTQMDVSELLRCPTTRLIYWYATTSAIPLAGFRTGSIIFACSFSAAADSETLMTRAVTLRSLAFTVLVLGNTKAEVGAVRISDISASRNSSCQHIKHNTQRQARSQRIIATLNTQTKTDEVPRG